jgi:DNA repair protein RadD
MLHGPVGAIDATNFNWKPRGKNDEPQGRVCPECESINTAGAEHCVDCGFVFEKQVRQPKHAVTAQQAPILEQTWLDVDRVEFYLHRKRDNPDAPPTLRVEFKCGFAWHKEWVCIQHQDFLRSKAEQWWQAMGGLAPVPATVAEALERRHELDTVVAITTRKDADWWRVINRRIERGGGEVDELNEYYRSRTPAPNVMRPLSEEMADSVPF